MNGRVAARAFLAASLALAEPLSRRYAQPEKAIPVHDSKLDLDTATVDRRRAWEDLPEELDKLREFMAHAAHLLPAQGPITVFIHHNTLHAFEESPFSKAVVDGARTFGCQPYLAEEVYRRELQRGRIRMADISSVLLDDLGPLADGLIGFCGTRFHLRLAMLQYPLPSAPGPELRWYMAEAEALRRWRSDAQQARGRTVEDTRHWVMRDLRPNGRPIQAAGQARDEARQSQHHVREMIADLIDKFGHKSIEGWPDSRWEALTLNVLWRICLHGVHGLPVAHTRPTVHTRHRDLLLEVTGEDSDRLVHDVLIAWCAAFLDQGFAPAALPGRELGFFRAFAELYGQPGGPPDRWRRALRGEWQRLLQSGLSPLQSIRESLQLLGVERQEAAAFLESTLLALRGWAGMVWQMESRADRAVQSVPPGSLIEFLAVRLVLDRLALADIAAEKLAWREPLSELRTALRNRIPRHEVSSVEQRAFHVFQLAQVLQWTPAELQALSKQEWSLLVQEIEAFSNVERRRVFQLAYERRYRIQSLDAVLAQTRRRAPVRPAARFQVVCCLDEREESFRRHLEEAVPEAETFGAAGFFGVAMYYRGAADAHFVPLCPVIIRPQHYVREDVVDTLEPTHRRRAWTRQLLGRASHRLHLGSRSFAGGALLTTLLGPLASFPLIARILFPRLTAHLRRWCGRWVQPPAITRLELERSATTPGPEPGHLGYTVQEMATIVERLLREIGLTKQLARLIVIMGHGSSSLNNPHESAHDCGACGGGRGGPNARAFARMANDPRVRDLLQRQGLAISPEVCFVGAFHNTCDESVTYFDLDRLPTSHAAIFEETQKAVNIARQRNAHERCRRFESAPLRMSSEAALRHVEGRAEDLAQTRPEYGHATNALCIIAPRSLTRDLYLDRRAFLVSYDPQQDDQQQAILTRILQAVVPVCGGINLEYYFSFTDPTGFGCGTKLPHNITSLLGVMDGAASDLRPGLPWQMVEVHEPVRLLFVIETTPESMWRIMERNEGVRRLILNQWVQLAVLHSRTRELYLLSGDKFVLHQPEDVDLPQAIASVDWYRGWRDHLGFAQIRKEVK
jgi:uncharacterized protein